MASRVDVGPPSYRAEGDEVNGGADGVAEQERGSERASGEQLHEESGESRAADDQEVAEANGLVATAWRNLKKLDRAAWIVARRLWAEAVEGGGPTWPPKWLSGTVVVLAVLLCFQVVFPVLGVLLAQLAVSAADFASIPSLLRPVTENFSNYLRITGPLLGVSERALLLGWTLTGLVIFVASVIGARGGRFAWVVFGVVSILLVIQGSTPPTRLVVGSVAAILWALVSLVAFRATSDEAEGAASRGGKKKRGNPRQIAERRAIELEFEDLADYFDRRRRQKPDRLAEELGISEKDAKRLRQEVGGISRAGGTPKAEKREAVEAARLEGADLNEVARRNGVKLATLKAWMKELEGVGDSTRSDEEAASSGAGAVGDEVKS